MSDKDTRSTYRAPAYESHEISPGGSEMNFSENNRSPIPISQDEVMGAENGSSYSLAGINRFHLNYPNRTENIFNMEESDSFHSSPLDSSQNKLLSSDTAISMDDTMVVDNHVEIFSKSQALSCDCVSLNEEVYPRFTKAYNELAYLKRKMQYIVSTTIYMVLPPIKSLSEDENQSDALSYIEASEVDDYPKHYERQQSLRSVKEKLEIDNSNSEEESDIEEFDTVLTKDRNAKRWLHPFSPKDQLKSDDDGNDELSNIEDSEVDDYPKHLARQKCESNEGSNSLSANSQGTREQTQSEDHSSPLSNIEDSEVDDFSKHLAKQKGWVEGTGALNGNREQEYSSRNSSVIRSPTPIRAFFTRAPRWDSEDDVKYNKEAEESESELESGIEYDEATNMITRDRNGFRIQFYADGFAPYHRRNEVSEPVWHRFQFKESNVRNEEFYRRDAPHGGSTQKIPRNNARSKEDPVLIVCTESASKNEINNETLGEVSHNETNDTTPDEQEPEKYKTSKILLSASQEPSDNDTEQY